MTQIILDVGGKHEVRLPESIKGGYQAEYSPLSVDVEMITGRVVRELRGNVWKLSYQYGFLDDETKNKVISACQKGRRESIRCGFLPPDSNGLLSYSDFFVTDFSYPKFMWSRFVPSDGGSSRPAPMWADFSMQLREVKPHD